MFGVVGGGMVEMVEVVRARCCRPGCRRVRMRLGKRAARRAARIARARKRRGGGMEMVATVGRGVLPEGGREGWCLYVYIREIDGYWN